MRMSVLTSFEELSGLSFGAVTIGNFDGFHRGHRSLIQALSEKTGSQPSLLITFDPHPREVIEPGCQVDRLSSWEDLVQQLNHCGVNFILRLKFDESLKNTTAAAFLHQLEFHSSFRHLVVGHDFALGSRREGDASFLSSWCSERKIGFLQVPPFKWKGEIVSSQKIRGRLKQGFVDKALDFLGRPYSLSGVVVHGDKRGRQIQFPTANIQYNERLLRPAEGVYGGRVQISSQERWGVCNLGRRPTFKDQEFRSQLEVHILDFQEEIYDQVLNFEFLFRVRAEKKFSSKEELVRQIQDDIRFAREKFS